MLSSLSTFPSSWSQRTFLLAVLVVFSLLVFTWSFSGYALNIQTGSFDLTVKGKKTWSFQFGLGDAVTYGAHSNYPTNAFSLDQSLSVNVDGNIGDHLSLTADLSDQKPGYLQSFALRYDSKNWDGLLGDFTVGKEGGFTVYNKKLKGIRANGKFQDANLQLILSRMEGISKSKVFYGKSSEGEVLFSLSPPEAPWKERPYRFNIRGLQYYPLSQQYVEGFTTPKLEVSIGSSFRSFLDNWELGYLYSSVETKPKLELYSSQFKIVSEGSQDFLLLMSHYRSIVRGAVKDYINTYNEGKKSKNQRSYPFNEGTDSERKFLDKLATYVHLVLDGDGIPLLSYQRRSYYYLGHTDIQDRSVTIKVDRNGSWKDVQELSGYDFKVYEDKGIAKLEFPPSFYEPLQQARVRISFRYSISGNMFMLGFSVTPDSEKVYLNGKLLQKGTDYTINYKTGALMLFKDVSSTDRIKVDYEKARGGLGGYAAYKRNFYGVSLSTHPRSGLDFTFNLFQAKDMAPGHLPPSARTMPNTHTVGGLTGTIAQGKWTTSFKVARSVNRFPLYDNQRNHAPSQINDIAEIDYKGERLILFAQQNGLTLYNGTEWTTYTTADGLAGDGVFSIEKTDQHLLFGTSSGLTIFTLKGDIPFDRAINWHNLYKGDGLPAAAIQEVLVWQNLIWIGTSQGVYYTDSTGLTTPANWTPSWTQLIPDSSITDFAPAEHSLWVGTNAGLFQIIPDNGSSYRTVTISSTINVNEALVGPEGVYTAHDQGIRLWTTGGDHPGGSWELRGKAVYSLAYHKDSLWYGSSQGFTSLNSAPIYGNHKITSLEATTDSLWGGGKAYLSANEKTRYLLTIYKLVGENLASFSSNNIYIKAKDENRFLNIGASEHTDKGNYFRGSITRDLQYGEWGGKATSLFVLSQPTYSPIGQVERAGKMRWGVNFDLSLSEGLSVGGSRFYTVEGLVSHNPQTTVKHTVSLSWREFYNLTNTIKLMELPRGEQKLSASSSVGGELLGGDFSWTAGFTGESVFSGGSWWRHTSLKLTNSLSFSPIEGLTFGVNYAFPFSGGDFNQPINDLHWSASVSRGIQAFANYGVKLQLTGKGSLSGALTGSIDDFQSTVQAELRLDQFQLAEITYNPFVTASYRTEKNKNHLKGKVSLHGSLGSISSRNTLSRKLTYNESTRRTDLKDKLAGEIKFLPSSLQAPTLNYTLTRTVLRHPRYGKKSSYSLQGDFSINWSMPDRFSHHISLGVTAGKGTDATLTLNDSIQVDLTSNLQPDLQLSADYILPTNTVKGSLRGSVSYDLQRYWKLELTTGIGLSNEGETGFTQHLYGGCNIMAVF